MKYFVAMATLSAVFSMHRLNLCFDRSFPLNQNKCLIKVVDLITRDFGHYYSITPNFK